MGVSGSGKTAVGERLAEILAVPFYDADNYHNDKSIRKMKENIPLNDMDRKPWLSVLSLKIKEWNLYGDVILACSALKKSYRHKLSSNSRVVFIFLDGEYNLIRQRLLERKDHFFQESMLESQFSSLEKPENCIRVSINQSIDNICLSIINNIKRSTDAE
jgi:carbohydrate kinase (thermoresistant glucokinase family)